MFCELCGNTHCELLTEELRYKTEKKIYRCPECGLVFLHPKMTRKEEEVFYEQEYGEIFSTEKGTTPQNLFESRQKDAQLYLTWVQEFLEPEDDCLEIGCASGYFLNIIRERVNSVAGIETHHLLRQYCKNLGIPMYERIEQIGDEVFDKIFLFFVLEHIGEPIQFLKQLKKILKPEGMVFIVVPNVHDALLTLYDIPDFRRFYFTPAHQFYYSRNTLGNLLDQVELNTFDILPIQRYDISNHMHWMMFGKPGGVGLYDHIFSKLLRSEYAENLKKNDICDTLFAIASNNEV